MRIKFSQTFNFLNIRSAVIIVAMSNLYMTECKTTPEFHELVTNESMNVTC